MKLLASLGVALTVALPAPALAQGIRPDDIIATWQEVAQTVERRTTDSTDATTSTTIQLDTIADQRARPRYFLVLRPDSSASGPAQELSTAPLRRWRLRGDTLWLSADSSHQRGGVGHHGANTVHVGDRKLLWAPYQVVQRDNGTTDTVITRLVFLRIGRPMPRPTGTPLPREPDTWTP